MVQEVIDFDKLPIFKSKNKDKAIEVLKGKNDGNVIKVFVNENIDIENDFEIYPFEGSKYQTLISIFLTYPVDLIVELYDSGYPDFDVFSQYDIFLMLYKSNEALYCELMKFFLGDVELHSAVDTLTGEQLLYDESKKIVFDITSFMIMSRFIMAIHHISEDKSKTAKKSKALKRVMIESERARKGIREQLRQQGKSQEKSDGYLQKLITKITVASQFRRNELLDMKLYDFYETLNEVIGFHTWQFTMRKIAGGQYDNSKIKKDEINWFNN